MKKIVINLLVATSVCSLHCMNQNGQASQRKPPITVVVQSSSEISINQARLQGIMTDNNKIFEDSETLVWELKPNPKGQYDITPYIEAEHQFTMQDASKLVIEARAEGRSEGAKIPFVIANYKKYKEILSTVFKAIAVDARYKADDNNDWCSFLHKPSYFTNNTAYYDLTILCDEIYEKAYIAGQNSSKAIYAQQIKDLQEQNASKKTEKTKKMMPKIHKGYSTIQLCAAFGCGSICMGLVWWLKSHLHI